MFSLDQYEFLDCGRGRKLERFGEVILSRPAPAAQVEPRLPPSTWKLAHAEFERTPNGDGGWKQHQPYPTSWQLSHGRLRLELKPTPVGHLGVFPEQATNWDWIWETTRNSGRSLKVLNLFAYTGGSTLAAALAEAEVVHIDGAKNIVQWARRNAELSGMQEASIRWIAEDAQKFTQRELRRGNGYDAVILDPPSYGHGPKKEVWKIEQHLADLLADCFALTAHRCAFILLSCHSPTFDASTLQHLFHHLSQNRQGVLRIEELTLQSRHGAALQSGLAVRWTEQ